MRPHFLTGDFNMLLNNFSSGIKFYDDANFPFGFARSGDFTIMEAETLTNSGYVMNQLANKKISPENEEQEHFVAVIEGKTQPLYKNEHLYLKYKKLIEKKDIFLNPVKWVADDDIEIDSDMEEAAFDDD
jgi:uncharacterized protein YifE (UPF0438 family)